MSDTSEKVDLEKAPLPLQAPVAAEVLAADDGVDRQKGLFGKMWKVVLWADSFGVEARGIERVPEDERTHTSIFDAGTMWASANMSVATLSLGTLGSSIWYMGLTDACLTIVFFNILTTLPVAVFATWGMKTGLRQQVLGRFSFGRIGVYFPVTFNCISCIGWATINTIVGAQVLRAVPGSHPIPPAAAVVVLAIITAALALFGFKVVHHFERYASIPLFIIFVMLLGEAAPHVQHSMSPPGSATAASVLSFGGAICGFALSWVSYASDYTVLFPMDTSATKVFWITWAGLNFPLIFLQILGAALMTTFTAKTTWGDAYDQNGIGGLIAAPLSAMGDGFSGFLLVILSLSIVANNVPNMYSFSLTFQVFGKYAQAVPRMFLVILGTIIYIVLAIVGYYHFEDWLDTLLTVFSYYLAIYTAILLEEHYIFRRGSFSNYNLEGYNDNSTLPYGFAAIVAVCFGIMGTVLGMSQTWYVGKIAILIGPPPYGGDIGFELAGAFTALTYPVLRYGERKFFGR